MSEESNEVAENQAAGAGKNANEGKRKLVLFGVLALLLAMLGYDYRVARPAVDRAYDEIVDHVAEVNKSNTETVSNLDVRSLLGKEPSRSFNDGDYLVEVFSWRSGLPIRTHDLFAVYAPAGDEKIFYRHAKFAYEARGEVAPIPETIMAEQAPFDEAEQAALAARNQPRDMGPPAGGNPEQRGRPEIEEDPPAAAEDAKSDEAASEEEKKEDPESDPEKE